MILLISWISASVLKDVPENLVLDAAYPASLRAFITSAMGGGDILRLLHTS